MRECYLPFELLLITIRVLLRIAESFVIDDKRRGSAGEYWRVEISPFDASWKLFFGIIWQIEMIPHGSRRFLASLAVPWSILTTYVSFETSCCTQHSTSLHTKSAPIRSFSIHSLRFLDLQSVLQPSPIQSKSRLAQTESGIRF